MIELIAETAWHHEGDFEFMHDLISMLCSDSKAEYIKMHITLDLDEYMHKDHAAYLTLKSWMFTEQEWKELILLVRKSKKKLMLLVNDTTAIRFAAQFSPEIIELHSVCLNVPRLQKSVLDTFSKDTKVVIGVGGCSIEEVDAAVSVFEERETVLMFGFQNYPTRFEDVNLGKIRKIQSLYAGKAFGYADHTGWDEETNELVTLLVSANGMSYLEKHVTTKFGEKRCDSSAAISIEMFNEIHGKVDTLKKLYGNGEVSLNSGEIDYSKYGPMKMAAVATKKIEVGQKLGLGDFEFMRTQHETEMGQLDVMRSIGKDVIQTIEKNQVIQQVSFNK